MSNIRAILLMVAAMAAFATADAFFKRATGVMGVGQALFLVSAGNLAVFLPMLWREGGRVLAPEALDRAVMLRTLGEVAGSVGVIAAVATIPLATVSALMQAQPLALTLAAAVFLGERVGWRRWSAVGLGFVGVMVILRPGLGGFDPNMLWTLLGICGLTARDIGTRMLPKTVSGNFAIVWAVIALTLFSLGLMLALEGWAPMSAASWLDVAGASVAVTCAFILITAALRSGEVSAVAPFRYVRIVFALAIAIVLFGERPDAATWIGAALIIGSGIYAFWRERQLQAAAARRAAA